MVCRPALERVMADAPALAARWPSKSLRSTAETERAFNACA
jgi:hypothetical protein